MITVTHTAADGTVVTGDTYPHRAIVKAAGFRWSRNMQAWYLPSSRDKLPNLCRIGLLTDALQEAGVEWESEIETELRPVEEAEADLRERREARAEALADKADRRAAQAAATLDQAHEMASIIPFGQPILVGHYSEGRDRRYRDRIHNKMVKGVEQSKEADETARRAAAAAASVDRRERGDVVERRIKKMEADARRLDRRLAGCPTSGKKALDKRIFVADGQRKVECKFCWHEVDVDDAGVIVYHGGATGDYADRLRIQRQRLDEELAYWRDHLAGLVDSGAYRKWGPEDFAVGDRVNDRATVIRVNKKSLTVQFDAFAGTSLTYSWPYSDVKTRQPKEETCSPPAN